MSMGRAFSRARGIAMLTLALGAVAVPAVAQELEVVPGVRLGALLRDGGEADLIAAYGTRVVRPVDVDLGEGEHAPGTLLFPEDQRRRVEIVWRDGAGRRVLAQATLRGAATSWRLPGGLTLGLTLEQVERLNGGPFRVAGFAWDGGGIVLSWQGGGLAEALGGAVLVFFAAGESAQQRPEFLEVQGDRPFASDLAALRALAPTVGRIVVGFEPP
jgi:hypothetical protein